MKGFPLKVMVQQPIPVEYKCGLCDLLLRQPMQSLCGHRFCMVCIYNREETPCPVCQREPDEALRMENAMVGMDTVHPDNAFRRMMIRQPARCVNCDWKGLFGDYEATHYGECQMHKMACPDCGEVVVLRDLEEHKSRYCRKRSVECSRCGENIPAVNLEQHETQLCPKVLVQCDSCSAAPMLREKLAEHYEKFCNVVKIPCPYDCVFVFIEPSKLEEHERKFVLQHTRTQHQTVCESESVYNVPNQASCQHKYQTQSLKYNNR